VLVLVLVLVRGAFRSIARKLLLRVCQRDVRRDRTFCIMRVWSVYSVFLFQLNEDTVMCCALYIGVDLLYITAYCDE